MSAPVPYPRKRSAPVSDAMSGRARSLISGSGVQVLLSLNVPSSPSNSSPRLKFRFYHRAGSPALSSCSATNRRYHSPASATASRSLSERVRPATASRMAWMRVSTVAANSACFALASWVRRPAGIVSLASSADRRAFRTHRARQPGLPYALSTNQISTASCSQVRMAFVLPVCARAVEMPSIFQQVTDPV
jgi:hypothetical protein